MSAQREPGQSPNHHAGSLVHTTCDIAWVFSFLVKALFCKPERDDAFVAFFTKAELVVNGVRADPTEGPDSSLIEAMGYTRKSERKSGLTTKKKQTPNPPSP